MGTHLKAYGYRMAVAFGIIALVAFFLPKDTASWFFLFLLAMLVSLPLEVVFYYWERDKTQQTARRLEKLKGLLAVFIWVFLITKFDWLL